MWAPTLSAARLNSGTAPWRSLPLKGLLFGEEYKPHTLSTMRLFTVFFFLHNEGKGVGERVTKIPLFLSWVIIVDRYEMKN